MVTDESAAPGMPESRTGAFSLGQDSDRYNAMVPKTFAPSSTLVNPLPGMNGMSEKDYTSRVLPGGTVLPTQNGSSSDSWQKSIMLRMMSQ